MFRSISHGFLTWTLSIFLLTGLLTSTLTSLVSSSAKTASAIVAKSVKTATKTAVESHAGKDHTGDLNTYLVNNMLRNSQNSKSGASKEVHAEIAGIIAHGIKDGELNKNDKDHLVNMVSQKAGITATEASSKVDEFLFKIKETQENLKDKAEKARKATISFFLFMTFAMVVGAALSCGMALIGGRKKQ